MRGRGQSGSRARSALALVAALAGLLAVPAAATATFPPDVAGTTTVVAAHSAVIDLALRSDVTFSGLVDRNPDAQVAGAGRLVGFYLYRQDRYGDEVMGLRLPSRAGLRVYAGQNLYTACYTGITQSGVADTCPPPSTRPVRLYQGLYRLVVLTDGAPVRVTLTFPGVAGTTVLRATRRVDAGVRAMTVLPDGTGSLARAFASAAPAGGGVLVSLVTARWGSAPRVAGRWDCVAEGLQPVDEQMLPGCPGDLTDWNGDTVVDPLRRTPSSWSGTSLSWRTGVSGGAYTVGQSLLSDAGVRISSGLAAWFELP